jgi:probable O-glycosylation ligase (exosortase A-associated)
VGAGMLLGWALQGFGSWNLGRARPVVTSLVFFLLWYFPSTIAGLDPGRGWPLIEAMAKVVLPFLVGITMITSMAQLKALAWVILVSHGYVALELNRSYYDGFNAVQEIGFGGMDNNCAAIAMVCCVGLGFFLGLHSERLWQKLLAFACAALTAHVIMLAFSRGGMLAMVVTSVVAFLLIPRKPVHYLYFALAVGLALRLAGPEVRERFFSSFKEEQELDASAKSRYELWGACWNIMVRKPLLGVGPENFPEVAPEYGFPRGKKAHTLWLEVGAGLGFPGLIALVAFYAICVFRLWALTKESRWVADPWVRHMARMVIASITGFAVAAQFVSLEGLEAPYYITLIGAGVLKLDSLGMLQPAAPVPTPGAVHAPVVWTDPSQFGKRTSVS